MIETRTHLHNDFLIQGVSNILLFKVKLLVYSFVPFFYKIYMKAISTPTDNGESVTVTTRKKN